MIKKVTAVFFSPLRSTARLTLAAARAIAGELGAELAEIDITLPEARRDAKMQGSASPSCGPEAMYRFGPEDMVVFGMPTYAGRIPNKIRPFMETGFLGEDTPAAALVTYGNRSYDSSFTELMHLLSQSGLLVAAGGAFPSRHAFSDELAPGRPDAEDLGKARELGHLAVERAAAGLFLPDPGEEAVAPYYTPKKENGEPAVFLKAKPVTDMSLCTGCGTCASVCPMGSIDRSDFSKVPGICIKCCACVRKCPAGAKRFDDPDFTSHVRMLERDFKAGKEVILFPMQ